MILFNSLFVLKKTYKIQIHLTKNVKNVNNSLGKSDNMSRAYTFVDSMTQFGGAVVQDDLEEAYRRVGLAFKGQLEQHFVILREALPPRRPPTGSTTPSAAPPAASHIVNSLFHYHCISHLFSFASLITVAHVNKNKLLKNVLN